MNGPAARPRREPRSHPTGEVAQELASFVTPGWAHDALCPEIGRDMFHSDDKGESYDIGRRACALCPVKAPCLADAFLTEGNDTHGLRAGLSPKRRRRIAPAAMVGKVQEAAALDALVPPRLGLREQRVCA